MRLRRDAGRYAITRVYAGSASDEDGGTEEVGALPPGFIAMPETQWMEPCDGGPAFFVAFQGQAEFPCSCRVTAECEWNIPGQWEPAPIGSTLSPGRWRDTSDGGTACYRKVCMEIAGESSWPAECPTE